MYLLKAGDEFEILASVRQRILTTSLIRLTENDFRDVAELMAICRGRVSNQREYEILRKTGLTMRLKLKSWTEYQKRFGFNDNDQALLKEIEAGNYGNMLRSDDN